MVANSRGFGLAGEYPAATIDAAAVAVERAGYQTFWLSQPTAGDSLAALARVGELTDSIRLGVGAIPFTYRPAAEIAQRVASTRVPRDRLRLGVGSGVGVGAMSRLREGVQELRSMLAVEIAVAPLGPKMCQLAGELADTVLLNWLTPGYAAISTAAIRTAAARAGRPSPTIATYVRCAIDPTARPRLAAECARYGSFPHYAAHFRRQGVEPHQTTIEAASADELQARLAAYEVVLDHVVVRAVTAHDSVDEVLALVEAGKPPE